MRNLFVENLIASGYGIIQIFLLSIYSVPTNSVPVTVENVTTIMIVPSNSSNKIPIIPDEQSNVSDFDVARTISLRTGKALGVPSDFTKQFNTSDGSDEGDQEVGNATASSPAEGGESAPAQLNAGPAITIAWDHDRVQDTHPGSNITLSEYALNEGNLTGNETLFDADAKPVELEEPRLQYIPPEPTAKTPEDKMIQKIFGGECTMAVWKRCNKIRFWGGDYLVPDKTNPGKMIVKHHKIRCVESPEHTICLRNGWTVARCHMLCMSQCNLEFRMEYEKLVSHEGDCKFPLLLRK